MKISTVLVRGKPRIVLDLGTRSGRRRRQYFRTREEAEAAAAASAREDERSGRIWARLPAERRREVVELLEAMRTQGVTLREVWEAFQRNREPVRESIPLREAVRMTVEAKSAANLRPRYVRSLEEYLGIFARGRETLPISAIGPRDLEEWFQTRRESPSSRASNLGRLSAMFSLAVRRGLLAENPCDRVERVRVETGRPAILSVEEASRILRLCRQGEPRLLPVVVLGMFAGIRPEEIRSLAWEKVDLDRGIVTIDPDVSKVRTRRIVELAPVAVQWLRLCARRRGPIASSYSDERRRRRRIRDASGVGEWKQDVLRHTAASFLLARDRDEGRVALSLGTSPRMLFRNYRELVTAEDCAQFWELSPETVCEGKPRGEGAARTGASPAGGRSRA